MDVQISACRVGILGTSLSAIDAAMAVACQHGAFTTGADNALQFICKSDSQSLKLTLMSRNGVLPEADFYCPLPYESLNIATPEAIEDVIVHGQKDYWTAFSGLLYNNCKMQPRNGAKR